jgi:hypothetical protein
VETVLKIFLISVLLIFPFERTEAKSVDFDSEPAWGFFVHRLANKYAIFTLPAEMMPLFKNQIRFLEENAVNPDKRRYATKFEFMRHYIDIDHWGSYPFVEVPRNYDEAILKYASFILVNSRNDSLVLKQSIQDDFIELDGRGSLKLKINERDLKRLFNSKIMPQYYDDEWFLDIVTVLNHFECNGLSESRFEKMLIVDNFSNYGIIPYYLEQGLEKLTKAFERKNTKDILRHAADLGHYVGDAHVPLHTTLNYNGQLTDQIGIHGFWESRIPELFAKDDYDFFVGKASYIEDPKKYFWDIVLESHLLVDSVLGVEKRLSLKYPEDQQFCYDERLGRTVRTYCREYARAYQAELNGMVEARLAATISAIGNVWYTAWVNAGQPDLRKLEEVVMEEEKIVPDPNISVREYDGK